MLPAWMLYATALGCLAGLAALAHAIGRKLD